MQVLLTARQCRAVLAAVFGAGLTLAGVNADARAVQPPVALITSDLVRDLRQLLNNPIVPLALGYQNGVHEGLTQSDVRQRDQTWVNEVNRIGIRPLVGSVMSNPLSNFVMSVQAGSLGLMSQILVVDRQGLNAGLSAPSEDYFQADERFFQDAIAHRGAGVVVGQPSYHAPTGTWRVKVSFPIKGPDEQRNIGVTRIEINLTELERRSKL